MSDDNTEGLVAGADVSAETPEISPITHVAIGMIETYSPEQLDQFIELSTRIGNERITTQLIKVITSLKDKEPLGENDVLALAFMLLLGQQVEPPEEESPIILDA